MFAKHAFFSGLAALASVMAVPVSAKPVTDCPLRDMPFSAASPLIDVLLSPAARAVLDKAVPGRFTNLPSQFAGTQPPTFAAILSLREAAGFLQIKDDTLATIDTELRALPVTAADKAARCARYDNDVPKFALPAGRPKLLLFEKINGFRDGPSVDAARASLEAMARRKGWAMVVTEKGGAFNPATLRQFDAVIWNNVSGDVLTLAQRRALQSYVEGGGGFVAMHGSAGDPVYFWDWYADTLIGARFKGHPQVPHFQEARIAVNEAHPLAKALPKEWRMTDEWYSFKTNPRAAGANIVLTLDESTYQPVGMMNQDLRMGDHPLAWTNCVGKGRMFYSAIGHMPETYGQPQHVALLEDAITWASDRRTSCAAGGKR
ncbi:ThuA domain-containing protein [Sphingobium sp. H39-3-25]|uniref:ThuA domain-containing protein n=1 Tax=Sphingobium arseniciresistens TaxID=3030834 RepID=UPI0023BA04FD|nr:ThuA domain-containing protein [Sphingobium arseniciresistens]